MNVEIALYRESSVRSPNLSTHNFEDPKTPHKKDINTCFGLKTLKRG